MTATPRSGRARQTGLAAAAALVLALSACSGDADPEPPPEEPSSPVSGAGEAASLDDETTEDPLEEPYLPVPDGVELTPQGSLLGLGDVATVAFRPNQKKVGVLDLEVRELEKTSFEKSFQGWKLDAKTKKTTPYFVRASVRNVGGSNLSGVDVPLYLLDDAQTLVEPSSFEGDFDPCGSKPLPQGFKDGEKTNVCLVYLAPPGRTLEGVSFRPDQDFDAITWTGAVAGTGSKNGGKKNKGGGAQNDGAKNDGAKNDGAKNNGGKKNNAKNGGDGDG